MDTGAIVTLLVEALLVGGILLFAWRQRRRAAEPALAVKPRQGAQEVEKLRRLRERHLNEPLSELSRPARLEDIVGQEEGIRALRAALCGPNPQHVILYGPPGVGKTCAARLVLEEAKKSPDSPFTEQSEFVEMDATCIRFDERAIADPLIGSVHDPIYQGAGALGSRGVPQPKPGAVTRAHCGVLFLDEIGELHPMQMNKLLKVLEDRRVRFESAYYSPDNAGIPAHIHDIFENGLPADFRLIGATTRPPEELPAALRAEGGVVFLLCGDILNIGELIARVHAANRRAVVHADLVAGLAPREIAVDFLQCCGADGIISTRPLLIRRGRELGLLTVLRAFVIDSKAIESLAREAESAAPDVVEMLPAPMPRVVRRLAQSLRAPLIAGGLITDKEDVLAALSAGALCVSTSDETLWSI